MAWQKLSEFCMCMDIPPIEDFLFGKFFRCGKSLDSAVLQNVGTGQANT